MAQKHLKAFLNIQFLISLKKQNQPIIIKLGASFYKKTWPYMTNYYKLLLMFLIYSFGAVNISIAQSNPWTPEDLVNYESASEFNFSPDGKSVVWVKRRPSKEKDAFVRDLYLTRLEQTDKTTYKTIQLTRGDDSDRNPLFSKDGELIYYLSSKNKSKAIWALNTLGGEPFVVDSFETTISSLKILDANTLFFIAEEGETLYEKELKKKKDDVEVIEDTAHFKANRIFAYDIKEKIARRITDNRFPVGEYAFSKDGKWLISSHIMSPHYGVDGKPKPKFYLWNLKDGSKTEILTNGYQTPGRFTFSEDNQGFYFISVKSSDPEWQGSGIDLLYYYDISSKKAIEVPLKWDWGLGGGFDVIGNDVIASLASGPTRKLVYYTKNGNNWTSQELNLGTMNERVAIAQISEDKKQVVFVYSTASIPPQYWLGQINRDRKGVAIHKVKEISRLNTAWDKKTKAKAEIARWKGAQGDNVTGILYYPHNYKAGRKYPLILSIHGGPSGVDLDEWGDSWGYYYNIMAQKGAFVLAPNYHGSSDHGLKFVESIKKHYYDLEMEDILTGIDHLEGKGFINKDSMGVMGWSNGAILTTMLTVRYPDMFKVAGAGAGDVNWTSDYGTCEFGITFDQSYIGGAPWDDVNGKNYNEAYITKSPLFDMEKVKTPTIIFHGSEDRAVPRDQGWEYYRALQQIGQTPVRFLWFPGQPHGLQKISHQLRKMNEEIAWFDRYLYGKADKSNEAFKEDSPLAMLLKKEKAAKTNGLFGQMKNGVLIPEVVLLKKDSTSLGRFEVTNAQFKAYDKNHHFETGQENHPVYGISYQHATAYIQWLSEKTGEKYRLPNETEVKEINKSIQSEAANENTLNYWAGYEITLDEVVLFQKKLSDLKTLLLKECGSFKPAKIADAEIYDLGGNVAEYYSKKEGSDTYGYCAYDYVDSSVKEQKSKPDYIGFRVVRE